MGGICNQEPGSAVKSTFTGLPVGVPLLFTVTARNEAGVDSTDQVSNELVLAVSPQVQITRAPAEGSHTKPQTTIEFSTSIPDAEVTCFLDGVGTACTSPVILSNLTNGRHTFLAKTMSEGGQATTPLRSWNVDGLNPKAVVDDLPVLARKGIPRLKYSAVDHGGSGLAGYEIRTRTNGLLGTFSAPVVRNDPSTLDHRIRRLPVDRGTTICASVRASDRVGNVSPWSPWKCASRPLDETALEMYGYWTPVSGRFFSNGQALRSVSPGSSLSVKVGRSEAVSVTAVPCSTCGRLEIRHRGQVVKVVNLRDESAGPDGSKAAHHTKEFTVPWPEAGRGDLTLVVLGGGPVTVDGVTVVRQR